MSDPQAETPAPGNPGTLLQPPPPSSSLPGTVSRCQRGTKGPRPCSTEPPRPAARKRRGGTRDTKEHTKEKRATWLKQKKSMCYRELERKRRRAEQDEAKPRPGTPKERQMDRQAGSLAWWDTVGSAAGTGWDPPASRSLRSEPDEPKGPFAARKQLPQLIKHEKLQPDERGGKQQPCRRELERIALRAAPAPPPRASPAGPGWSCTRAGRPCPRLRLLHHSSVNASWGRGVNICWQWFCKSPLCRRK